MGLNGLHDVRKEALALRNESVLPHFVGDEADEIGREKHFLRRGYVRRVGYRHLEAADETLQNVLIQTKGIIQQFDLLLRGVVVNVREVSSANVGHEIEAVVCDRHGTWVVELIALDSKHELVR